MLTTGQGQCNRHLYVGHLLFWAADALQETAFKGRLLRPFQAITGNMLCVKIFWLWPWPVVSRSAFIPRLKRLYVTSALLWESAVSGAYCDRITPRVGLLLSRGHTSTSHTIVLWWGSAHVGGEEEATRHIWRSSGKKNNKRIFSGEATLDRCMSRQPLFK